MLTKEDTEKDAPTHGVMLTPNLWHLSQIVASNRKEMCEDV